MKEAKKVEVRCCCNPYKLLGWFYVHNPAAGRTYTFHMEPSSYEVYEPIKKIELTIHQYINPLVEDDRVSVVFPVAVSNHPTFVTKNLAFKAEGYTKEDFKNVPGFIENVE